MLAELRSSKTSKTENPVVSEEPETTLVVAESICEDIEPTARPSINEDVKGPTLTVEAEAESLQAVAVLVEDSAGEDSRHDTGQIVEEILSETPLQKAKRMIHSRKFRE